MKGLLFTAMATLAALPAHAWGWGWWRPPVRSVPEISALEGAAALAVVAAVMLLVWERRRARAS